MIEISYLINMNNSEVIYRLFAWVLHDDMEKYEINEEDVIKGIERMNMTYKHNPLKLKYPNAETAEFNFIAFRCAYLHKFAPFHCVLVHDIFNRIIKEKYNFFKNMIMDMGNLHLCSLGGGPGSDIIGAILALHDTFGLFSVYASIIDCMPQWNATLNSLLTESQNGTYGDLGLYLSKEFFNWSYIGSDLLDEFTSVVKKAISTADIINMVKFLSAATCIDTETMIKRIFNLMKPGAIVFFIDNSVGKLKHIISRVATELGLDPLFGPINHENYVNEMVKITRFGYSSCFKTKIAIHVWAKPFRGYYAEQNEQLHKDCKQMFQTKNTPISDSQNIHNYEFSLYSHDMNNYNINSKRMHFDSFKQKSLINLNSRYSETALPVKISKTGPKRHLEMIENISLDFKNCSFDHLLSDESLIPLYYEIPKSFKEKHLQTISTDFNASCSLNDSQHEETVIPLYPETPQRFRKKDLQPIQSKPISFTSLPVFNINHSCPKLRNVNLSSMNNFTLLQTDFNASCSLNDSQYEETVIPLFPETPQRFRKKNLQPIQSKSISFTSLPVFNINHSNPILKNVSSSSMKNFTPLQNRIVVFEQNKSLNSSLNNELNEIPECKSIFYNNDNHNVQVISHKSSDDFSHSDFDYRNISFSDVKEPILTSNYHNSFNTFSPEIPVSDDTYFSHRDSGYMSTCQSDIKISPLNSTYYNNLNTSLDFPVFNNSVKSVLKENFDRKQWTNRNTNEQTDIRTIYNPSTNVKNQNRKLYITSPSTETLVSDKNAKNNDWKHINADQQINHRFHPYRKVEKYMSENKYSNDYESNKENYYISNSTKKYQYKIKSSYYF